MTNEQAIENTPAPAPKARKVATEAPARGRGRPENFPGVPTTKRLYNLPTETIKMIEALAGKREANIGVTLDAMIRRAYKEATRSK